jgi:hypothetical protein
MKTVDRRVYALVLAIAFIDIQPWALSYTHSI